MIFSEVQLECVADTANALGRALLDKCLIVGTASESLLHPGQGTSAVGRSFVHPSTFPHTHMIGPTSLILSLQVSTQIPLGAVTRYLLIKLRMLF